jgi:membrane-bound lytic murein transglycosylase B
MVDQRDAELIARAAAERDVPPELLMALIGLESEIPDVNAWGARTLLIRRVAEVLDAAPAQVAAR